MDNNYYLMQKIMMTGIFDVKNKRIKNKITFEILLKYFKNKKWRDKT